ncbi:MAG: hypothetical protein PGN21_10680 [Sphingomonas paucimobilis]
MTPLLLAATVAAATPWAEATGMFRVVQTSPDTLRLSGAIRDEDDRQFAAALSPNIRRVTLNSAGGQASTALRMAALIEGRRIEVVVDGICASSCANYLFAAGAARSIRPGSVVLWHGAPDEASRADMRAQLLDLMRKDGLSEADVQANLRREDARLSGWIAEQNALFDRKGLNLAILYGSGRAQTERATELFRDEATATPIDFAYLSAPALRCAGFDPAGGDPRWPTGAPATLGLTNVRIVALPDLERRLCARKRR